MITQQRQCACESTARQREAHGFTLTETLTVVAIIVILFAVAAPNVIAAQKRLEVSRLNARAQAIYNTVQNRMSALQSNGNLQELSDRIDGSSLITTRPADYKDSWATAAEWQADYSLYYFEGASEKYKGTGIQTNEALTELLLSDDAGQISRELYNGKWLVELSPTTGEVYAVYYWEGDLKDAADGKSRQSQLDSYLANGSLDDTDHGCAVGYFCGGPIDKTIRHARQRYDDLRWRLVNSEDLYVAVCSDDFSELTPSQLKLTVTVTGVRRKDGKQVSWRYSTTGDKLGMELGDTEIDVVLDSLRTGNAKSGRSERMCFANIMSCDFGGSLYANADCTGDPITNPTSDDIIMPGTDIDVSVVTEYISDDGKTEMGLSSKSLEPLADGWIRTNASTQNLTTLTTNSTIGAYSSDNNGTVYVWATRHLENLRMTDNKSPYYNWETTLKDNRTDFKHIVLTAAEDTVKYGYTGNKINRSSDTFMEGIETGDIDFSWEGYGNVHCASIDTRKAGSSTGMNPLPYFRPITFYNDEPFGEGSSISGKNESGGNHTIKNFIIKNNVEGTGDNVGLFAKLGMSVSYLNLVNFTVTGRDNVGALAGNMANEYVDLDDVHVYVDNKTTDGAIDYTSCSITASDGYVGGIIGHAKGQNTKYMKNCSASINISGGVSVGGLVGVGQMAEVNGCSYGMDVNNNGALGVPTISASGNNTGGIIGWYNRDDGSFSACTMLGNVNSSGHTYVGGIVGYAPQGGSGKPVTFNQCYVGCYSSDTNTQGGPIAAATMPSITGGLNCGGVTGYLYAGSYNDCHVIGNVTSGQNYIGGIDGFAETNTDFTNCSFGGNVAGSAYVAGIIGQAKAEANIKDCTVGADGSSGFTTIAASSNYVGGVAGYVGGSVSISNVVVGSENSKGTVWSQQNYAGGLVGNIDSGSNVITECTVVADISASGTDGYIGGLVGYQRAGTLDILSCNVGGDNLARKNQAIAIYGLGHNIGGLVGCVGTEKNNAFTQLTVKGADKNNKSVVTANIYSYGGGNHVAGLVGHDRGTANYRYYRVGLAGLGDNTVGIRSFVQSGAGASDDCEYVGGLVAEHEGGNIFNCDVIAAIQGASLVGGFVGDAQGSSDEFRNLTYSAPIRRQDNPDSLFAGIYATPFTSGSNSYVGGGFGRLNAAKVVGCSVEANVYNTNIAGSTATGKSTSYTGGFVGLINGGSSRVSIENSHVSGDFSSNPAVAAYIQADTNYVGGFIGSAGTSNVDIKRNYASVAVLPITTYAGGTNNQATDLDVCVGGFIGYLNNTDSEIHECYSSSIGRTSDDVRANNPSTDSRHTSAVGGFIGRADSGKITNCYSTSNVMGNQYTGGFAGYLSGTNVTIFNSIAYGIVTGEQANLTHPFAGAANNANASGNLFLTMSGHNEGATDSFASAADYDTLATGSNTGYPYTASLGNTFPFATVISINNNAQPHYGDWPAKVVQSNVTWNRTNGWDNTTEISFTCNVAAASGWQLVIVFDRDISSVNTYSNYNAAVQGNTVTITSGQSWNNTMTAGASFGSQFSSDNAGQPVVVSADLK